MPHSFISVRIQEQTVVVMPKKKDNYNGLCAEQTQTCMGKKNKKKTIKKKVKHVVCVE